MRRRQLAALFLLCLSGVALTGCKRDDSSDLDKGMALVKKGEYEQSFGSFEAAIKERKDVQLAYRGEGLAYMGMEDYEGAIEAFDEALKAKENSDSKTAADIACYKASAQMKLKAYEEAAKTYSDIPDFDENAQTEYLRGVAYLQAGRKAKALKDFEMAVGNEKEDYELYLSIYQSLKEHGFAKDGKKYLDTILKESSGKGYKDKLLRGKACYYMEKYDEALALFEDCAKDKDDAAEVYNWLGMCKLQVKDKSALADIQKGIALKDESFLQQLLFNEVVAYERFGDFKKAREKMERYVEEYPDDSEALREYEFLKTR